MDENKIEQRLASIDEKIGTLASSVSTIASNLDMLAALCAREFSQIHKKFDAADERLNVIEGKMEAFARRVDHEVEERHALGERVSKLEKTI
jgi:tetrahydromethanopterin S-methyltransferase subunit G